MFLLLLLEAWAGEGGLEGACKNAVVGAGDGMRGDVKHAIICGNSFGLSWVDGGMHTWQWAGVCQVMLHIAGAHQAGRAAC